MPYVPHYFEAETLAADHPRFVAALNLQVAQMRRLLDLMAPSSAPSARRALDETHADATLALYTRNPIAAGGHD